MHVVLPLVGYILGLLVFHARGGGWRDSAIRAATLWGVLVVLITELLSFPGWLTKAGVAFAWLLINAATLGYLWPLIRQKASQRSINTTWKALHQWSRGLGRANIGLLSGVSIVLAVVGVVALLSPPNTPDVMAYHLPRVMHWIQNRSAAFYPTHDLRQLHMPPWAEFAILQLHALAGGDGLNNLIQWFSLVASVLGVTLLAQSLGAGYRGQVLAAVICVTIPQGLLQASGAKNDYVAAFWLLALSYYMLHFKREPTLASALGLGAALGLAWLTKGTAYFLSLGILIAWGLAWLWKASNVRRELRLLVVAFLFAIGLNSGHFVRNYNLYGSPLGPGAEGPPDAFKYTNDEITLSTVVTNAVRNIALHLGSKNSAVNEALEHGVTRVIQAFGGDVNDPRATWDFTTFYVPSKSYHEDRAGNPIHLALIVVALGITAGVGALRKSTELVAYTLGLALAFILFCAFLRWQPWNTRLHLPLFVLWSAVTGVVLERAWLPFATTIVGILLLSLSVRVALNNHLRPLAFGKEFNILQRDRISLYFADRRDLIDSYRAVAEFVKNGGCRDIGLDLPPNSYEYPFYKVLEATEGAKQVRPVGVTNLSAVYGDDGSRFQPCAVICPQCSPATEKWGLYTAKVGAANIFKDIVVFSAKGGASHCPVFDR